MGTKNSDYTRTERVLLAVKRLLGEPGWVSVAELARLTNAPRPACRDDLELVRKFVTLEEVDGEPEPRWVMPGRSVVPRDQTAYELASEGLAWGEVTARSGFATQTMAKAAARRYAVREGRAWPPGKVDAGS